MNQTTDNSDYQIAGIGRQYLCWLGPCGRFFVGLFGLAFMLSVNAADTGNITETRFGEALMQMDESGNGGEMRATSEGWRTCDVKQTGAGWGNVYLRLVCPGVTERWFIARADQKSEMLATALTAVTTSKKVNVYLAHVPSGYHEVQACYVKQ